MFGESNQPIAEVIQKLIDSILLTKQEESKHPINLVICDIPPFDDSSENVTLDTALDTIDSVQQSVIRAAVKNHRFVTVLTSPNQYNYYLDQLRSNPNQNTTLRFRQICARDAMWLIAQHDWQIGNFMTRELDNSSFPYHYCPLGIFHSEVR